VEVEQLTALEAVETVQVLEATVPRQDVNPYPDNTPVDILTRRYRILNQTWTPSSADLVFYPTTLLMNQATLSAYLSRFAMFRADLEITIQIVSNPNQFGLFGVSVVPYADANSGWLSRVQQSQADMHLLDIGQQNSIMLKLPYFRPYNYFTRSPPADYKNWRVIVTLFNLSTVTSGAPATISMDIFANFANIETAGIIPVDYGELQSTFGKHANGFVNMANTAYNILEAGSVIADMFFGPPAPNEAPTKKEESSSNVRMELMGDLSSPAVLDNPNAVVLGDSNMPANAYLPNLGNSHLLTDIAARPVFLQDYVFSNSAQQVAFALDPIPANSHCEYLSRMFRYFRGGSKLFLKFCCTASISARFLITLFPFGQYLAASSACGDVLSWVVSVKGSQDWSVGVPYLQKIPWLKTDKSDPEITLPQISIQLLDTLPQPFDKPVTVYMVAFASGAETQFAGLQSAIPMNQADGELQSVFSTFKSTPMLGSSDPFTYQGSVQSVYDIMGRFSTRELVGQYGPDLSGAFPFPLKITDWDNAYMRDNYDYLANLYKFYTGGNRVKILFSQAPANGLLQVTVGNTRRSSEGFTFKTGNSLSVTHQSIWPTVEFTFPYLNNMPYDSIWEPRGMYPQLVDQEAVMSKYLIAATPSTKMIYLMPIPDFWFTAEPSLAPRKRKKNEVCKMRRRIRAQEAKEMEGQLQSTFSTFGRASFGFSTTFSDNAGYGATSYPLNGVDFSGMASNRFARIKMQVVTDGQFNVFCDLANIPASEYPTTWETHPYSGSSGGPVPYYETLLSVPVGASDFSTLTAEKEIFVQPGDVTGALLYLNVFNPTNYTGSTFMMISISLDTGALCYAYTPSGPFPILQTTSEIVIDQPITVNQPLLVAGVDPAVDPSALPVSVTLSGGGIPVIGGNTVPVYTSVYPN
jgi:hypothetical protein